MQLPKSDQLNIASLSRLFDNKSECYKLFWFQAILGFVCDGKQEIRFEELIDEMIADAWYMVTEYHLNLGPRDTLEKGGMDPKKVCVTCSRCTAIMRKMHATGCPIRDREVYLPMMKEALG